MILFCAYLSQTFCLEKQDKNVSQQIVCGKNTSVEIYFLLAIKIVFNIDIQ